MTEIELTVPANAKDFVANIPLPEPEDDQSGWLVSIEIQSSIASGPVAPGDVAFLALLGGLSLGTDTVRLSAGRVLVASAESEMPSCWARSGGTLRPARSGDSLRFRADSAVALLAPNRLLLGQWQVRIAAAPLVTE